MNEHIQTSPNKNWDHAGHVQNDGGDDEGEEGEGEREEDPVGHCVVSVGAGTRRADDTLTPDPAGCPGSVCLVEGAPGSARMAVPGLGSRYGRTP
jgi:hypothetical protein